MIVPNPHPQLVKQMVKELDMNADGEIDLWEFCVHMQKRTDGLTKADLDQELDAAFQMFRPDAHGNINEAELRRVLMEPEMGTPLDEAVRASADAHEHPPTTPHPLGETLVRRTRARSECVASLCPWCAARCAQEMAAMLEDLATHSLELRDGSSITLQQLREHPCYQAS